MMNFVLICLCLCVSERGVREERRENTAERRDREGVKKKYFNWLALHAQCQKETNRK